MKLNCPITGLEWKADFVSASAECQHPFLASPVKKLPAQLSLFQSDRTSAIENHLLYCTLLLNTEHIVFSSPLYLTEELAKVQAAQMQKLANLVFTGVFHKSNIDLPAFCISKDSQDISNLIAIWEEELEAYRVSYLIAKQEHEARAMLSRVQRAFSNALMKDRKRTIIAWLNKIVSLPEFETLHPVSKQYVSCKDYWIEILCKAIDGDAMLSYPEKDIVEFKSHLEDNLPMNYAQEFSLLEEIQMAISRKQNYFGYSFVDSDEKSYSIEEVKPTLRRENFANISDYLNAIKLNRKS